MNQFSNIGSMFPGAEFKDLRENAKLALTLPGQPQITGLVVSNVHGDVITVIEQDRVRVLLKNPTDHAARALGIARVEFEYWEKVCDDDPGGYGIAGMGAATNILGAIVAGTTAEEFRANIEKRDKPREEAR